MVEETITIRLEPAKEEEAPPSPHHHHSESPTVATSIAFDLLNHHDDDDKEEEETTVLWSPQPKKKTDAQMMEARLDALEECVRDVVRTNQFLIAQNQQLQNRQAERQAFMADMTSLAAAHQTQMLETVQQQQHHLGRLQTDILKALRAFAISFGIGGAPQY